MTYTEACKVVCRAMASPSTVSMVSAFQESLASLCALYLPHSLDGTPLLSCLFDTAPICRRISPS